jgi:hypothetical protein
LGRFGCCARRTAPPSQSKTLKGGGPDPKELLKISRRKRSQIYVPSFPAASRQSTPTSKLSFSFRGIASPRVIVCASAGSDSCGFGGDPEYLGAGRYGWERDGKRISEWNDQRFRCEGATHARTAGGWAGDGCLCIVSYDCVWHYSPRHVSSISFECGK